MNKALKSIGFILCGVIFVFTILYLTGIMENADNVFMPCLCALMFIQGFENLKVNKLLLAIISFAAGFFILIIIVFHFINILTPR